MFSISPIAARLKPELQQRTPFQQTLREEKCYTGRESIQLSRNAITALANGSGASA